MLRVTKFYARSFSLDEMIVWWEIDDILYKEDDIYKYEMTLYKSEAYYGAYDKVAGPFFNIFTYRDTTNLEDHKNRNIYYKLKIRNIETDEAIMVGPTAQLPEPDLIALEVMRQEDMLFRNHIGRKCYVFPRKTFGPRCICYDDRLKRQNIQDCRTCWDTSYLGGFLSPVVCFIQFDPNQRTSQLTPTIDHTPNLTTCRLLAVPPINKGDLIVDSENHRWIVLTVQVTRRYNYDLHAECQVKEIVRNDVLYQLPISSDEIKKVDEVIDERQYFNPQTFEYKERPNYDGFLERGRV